MPSEAIRLGRLLVELMPDEPEVMGLLALMLLEQSRSVARTTGEGELVPLPEQDRSRWDRSLIEEGQALVRRCLRRNQPGRYPLQAAINAVHSDALEPGATDCRQILTRYDQLLAFAPTAIVALNRAVAVAEVEGRETALTLIDELPLGHYHRFHAIRADLLRRAGRPEEARASYQPAIELADNAAEVTFPRRRAATLTRCE